MKKVKTTFNEELKRFAMGSIWSSILESLLFLVLGIILATFNDSVIAVINYILGCFLLISGLFKIILYTTMKEKSSIYNNDLFYGIVGAILGILLLIFGVQIWWLFRLIIGVWIVVGAIIRFVFAIKLGAAKIKGWITTMIMAILTFAIGLFIIFYSGSVIAIIGWVMVAFSIISVIADFIMFFVVNAKFKK